jgi:WD40 repeat protein
MVKFNQEQNKIFSSGDDSLIKVWDMGKVKRCYNLKGHTAGISAFKVCERNNELYSVSKDSTIKRWDLRTLECIATSMPQESEMTYVADKVLIVLMKTERIVASNRNGNVLFFDQELNLEYEVKIHDEEIRSIDACRDQDVFITGSFDGHVGIFS